MSWNIKTPGDYINGPLTVAGSATITGNLTVDTDVLKVDTANNRVGIGTSSPTAVLTVNGEISVTDNFALRLGSTQAGGATLLYNGNGNLDITPRSGFHTKLVDGNLIIGTSGKGIDFSATPGTGTSELLNDYEEGTWVPSQGGGLTVVGAFSSSGTYTKVGRLVTITGVVNGATSIAVAATSLLCGNLPFNSATEVTATAVNSTFTAGAFCAVGTASFYAVTSIAATPSIRFSATYVAA